MTPDRESRLEAALAVLLAEVVNKSALKFWTEVRGKTDARL